MFERVKKLTRMVFGRSGARWWFYTSDHQKLVRKVGDGSASSVVTAPLLWIGRNFPEAPPALWQKMPDSGEEERVIGRGELGGDHRMLELLERPNKYYSGAMLWMATVIDYHLSGDGYWLKIRDRGGRPTELWWAPSTLMTPKGDEDTFIDHYEYRPGAEPINVDPSDVVHFRFSLDPEDPRKGRSPLSALLHEVYTDQEASEFTSSLLRNMGVPGVVIAPKSDQAEPSAQDVKDTKAYFKEAFTGSKRGEPLVMSGPTSVSSFGFNPQQMQLREIRRIPEERVSAALGVPAIVAGLGAGLDRSTFANMEEARMMAYEDCLIPAQRTLSEEVRFQLLPDFEPYDFRSYRFGFDLSNVRVLQEDRNALAQRFDIGIKGGWVRVSEGRRALDLEVEDSDEVYLRGVAVIEVPAGEPAPALPNSPGQPAPALPPGEPPPELPPPLPETARRNGGGRKARSDVARQVQMSRVHTRLMAALTLDRFVLSRALASALESEFKKFGDTCAAVYQRIEGAIPVRGRGGTLVKQDFDPEVLSRMIVDEALGPFNEALQEQFGKSALRTLDQTLGTIKATTGIGVGVSEVAQRRIFDNAGKRLGLVDIEKSARGTIFNAINEGNQAGAGPIQIARSIRHDVPSGPFPNAGPSYRSQLIARTETNWAQNTASIAAYRESDVVSRVVALDGDSDPDCAERDGKEFSFDEAEVELANEHPNGTLCFAPVVAGNVPDIEPPPIPGPEAWQMLDEQVPEVAKGATRLTDRVFKNQDIDVESVSSLRGYCGSEESWIINESLRSSGPDVAVYYKDTIQGIDRAIAETVTERDFVTFRGVTAQARFDQLEVGETFTDHGFVSTTLSRDHALSMIMDEAGYEGSNSGMMVQAFIPRGSHAVSTEAAEVRAGTAEKEVILGRDSQFLVIDISLDDQIMGSIKVLYLGQKGQGSVPRPLKQSSSDTKVRSRFVWLPDQIERI